MSQQCNAGSLTCNAGENQPVGVTTNRMIGSSRCERFLLGFFACLDALVVCLVPWSCPSCAIVVIGHAANAETMPPLEKTSHLASPLFAVHVSNSTRVSNVNAETGGRFIRCPSRSCPGFTVRRRQPGEQPPIGLCLDFMSSVTTGIPNDQSPTSSRSSAASPGDRRMVLPPESDRQHQQVRCMACHSPLSSRMASSATCLWGAAAAGALVMDFAIPHVHRRCDREARSQSRQTRDKRRRRCRGSDCRGWCPGSRSGGNGEDIAVQRPGGIQSLTEGCAKQSVPRAQIRPETPSRSVRRTDRPDWSCQSVP